MGGPVCSQHPGPPAPTVHSAAGNYICHLCTPLGSTPEQTWAAVRRQNAILNSPYWREGGPAT
ncbi:MULTISPECIES: hypothetical protein [unclassified Streptomyces]|uniref:hypothetical protein n=1 Tax=unclassified Streptomyces TaxID=2593676 RepID=UPI003407C5A3